MGKIEVFTDGSYARTNIGVGYVIVAGHGETVEQDDFIVESKHLNMPQIKKHGSHAAEVLAVVCALEHLSQLGHEGEDVTLYCDLFHLRDYILGAEVNIDTSLDTIYDELDDLLERFSVTALDPKDAEHLPYYLSAIAHNASAFATGSNKRKKTTPDYTGPFSSDYTSPPHKKTNSKNYPSAQRAFSGKIPNGMEIVDEGLDDELPTFDPRHPDYKL